MNTIKLITPDFKVGISLNLNTIKFVCKEILQEYDMEGYEERTYDIPCVNVVDFELNTDRGYFYIYFEDNTFFQVKFESSCEIIIDHFKNDGELISEIGAWNFYDEPNVREA